MHFTPSKPLFNITVPPPKSTTGKATGLAVSSRPKSSTEQELKGYDRLKSRSSSGN
jgi:hypothetical protein